MNLHHLLLGLALLAQGCSQFTQSDAYKASLAAALQPAATGYAYQDVTYTASPSTTGGTNYAGVNLPSWASVNSSTGVLSGTPTTTGVTSGFSITTTIAGVLQNLGTQALQVKGNPYKTNQWHLHNIGQTNFASNGGTAGADINEVTSIASGLTGNGIKIAISDTGVYQAHPGLSPNILASECRDYESNSGSYLGDSTPAVSGTDSAGVAGEDDNAHGTAVAGLAAERGWTDYGGRGVAPKASIAGFKFIQAQDLLSTRGTLTSATLDQFAGDFDVYNYSWGDVQCTFTDEDSTYIAKLAYGVTNYRSGKGAIYVKAAGNSFAGYLTDCDSGASSNAVYLGNSGYAGENTTPYTIEVAAINAKGESSSYSSPGANVWVSSPGGEFGDDDPALTTTDYPGCGVGIKSNAANDFDRGGSGNSDCSHTSSMNGTSGATPIVSGAVAMMLEANPNLTWRDVKHILATTATKVDPTAGATNHPETGYTLSGDTYQQGWVTNAAGYHFHNWFGFGLVNVDAAVTAAKAYTAGSLGTFKQTNSGTTWTYDSGTLNTTIPDNSSTGVTKTLAVTQSWTTEEIQVRASITNCISDVGIELTSPSGTKSILMNYNSFVEDTAITNHVFLSNAFYGEPSNGTWTLHVVDAHSGCSNATLNNWQINVIGH